MNKVSIAKRQFRMEEWRKRIYECQARGIAVTNWYKQNGYCEQTYYKYLKKFREEVVDNLSVPIAEQPKPVAFKKMEVQTPGIGTQAAVVIRLNGATMEVNEDTSRQTVQEVLLALQSTTVQGKKSYETSVKKKKIYYECCSLSYPL